MPHPTQIEPEDEQVCIQCGGVFINMPFFMDGVCDACERFNEMEDSCITCGARSGLVIGHDGCLVCQGCYTMDEVLFGEDWDQNYDLF